MLEQHVVRVQLSVFEGRMAETRARRLAAWIEETLAPGDSLRVYFISETAERTITAGATPPVELHDFYLL